MKNIFGHGGGGGEEGREGRYLVCAGINMYVPCCHKKAKIQLAGWQAESYSIFGILSIGGKRSITLHPSCP